jgi:hypothetical protein
LVKKRATVSGERWGSLKLDWLSGPRCTVKVEGESKMKQADIQREILAALSHPEAEDGLYFNNLIIVHEEEERPIVRGEEGEVKEALSELIKAGTVEIHGTGSETIYKLKSSLH